MKNHFFPCLSTLDHTRSEPYHISLCYDEHEMKNLPVITFVSENEGSPEPILHLEEYEISGSQLVKSALTNLNDIKLKWDRLESDSSPVLIANNHRYASEKILDKAFLKAAAEQLAAEEILVGIPVQGTIFCCDASDADAVATVNDKVVALYNDFSLKQITKLLFTIKDGIIVSKKESKETTKKIELLTGFPKNFEEKSTKINLFGSLYTMQVLVSADNMDDLVSGMFISVHNILLKNRYDSNFNGMIAFQTVPGEPKKSRINANILQKYFDRIVENPTIKKLCSSVKEPVKLTFIFGEDYQTGDLHKKYKISLSN